MSTEVFTHPAQTDVIERLTAEGPIGLTAASKIVKRHPSTLARWAIDGIQLGDYRTVRLEAYRLGGKLATSKQAILRFIQAQQPGSTEPIQTEPIQTPAFRKHANSEAEAVLDAAGIR
jgi:hypothetical protein